jgi:thiol-disulfide isomerase/thioredoxin
MVRRRLPILLAALLAALVVLAGCAGSDAVDQAAGGQFHFVSANSKGKLISAADRKEAGNFTGDLLDGGTIDLRKQGGKVVVINFWATWCAPCVTETPQLDTVYRKYRSEGVQFIGIDTKESSKSAPKAFVRDNDISFPMVWDEQGKTAVQLGKIPALSLPFTVLVDQQQRVAAVYLGAITPKDLEPTLDKLLAEA